MQSIVLLIVLLCIALFYFILSGRAWLICKFNFDAKGGDMSRFVGRYFVPSQGAHTRVVDRYLWKACPRFVVSLFGRAMGIVESSLVVLNGRVRRGGGKGGEGWGRLSNMAE